MMRTNDKYILKGKMVIPENNLLRWGAWFEDNSKTRIVEQTKIGRKKFLSTVFLGLNHSFSSKGPPLLFETMLFGKKAGAEVLERYPTWRKAKNGHERYKEKLEELS